MNYFKKTFIMILSTMLLITLLMICYITFMLPSLYTEYMMKSEIENIDQLINENGASSVTAKQGNYILLSVPTNGSEANIQTSFGDISLEFNDEKNVEDIQNIISTMDGIESKEDFEEVYHEVIKEIKNTEFYKNFTSSKNNSDSNIQLDFNNSIVSNEDIENDVEMTILNRGESNATFLIHSKTTVENNIYSSYIAFNRSNDNINIMGYTSVINKFNVLPVVLSSLPMILLLNILIALLCATVVSKKLSGPIVKLTQTTTTMKNTMSKEIVSDIKTNDEVEILSDSINEMYHELVSSIEQLEVYNKTITKQQEREKLFIIGSSHYLKTPITTSLLLIDSMINKVGKYSDIETYLPSLKSEILNMKAIVDDMLETQSASIVDTVEEIDVTDIIGHIISDNTQKIIDKNLQVFLPQQSFVIATQVKMLYQVVENIVGNAIQYTKDYGTIEIYYEDNSIIIKNSPANISDEILDKIYDPFISGNNSHGLGLYLVKNYVDYLGYTITIQNQDDYVVTTLLFKEDINDKH